VPPGGVTAGRKGQLPARGGAKQKHFMSNKHKSLLNEPKAAYRNKRVPFIIPTYLGI